MSDFTKSRISKSDHWRTPKDVYDKLNAAVEEMRKGKTVVGLLRGDTSTRWFHDFVLPYARLRFIRGRLKFDGKKPAPFPSIIAIWKGAA